MPHLVTGVLLGRTFTPSKPGDDLRFFADNSSVTMVNPSGDPSLRSACNS
jgi:hypothetical protein